MAYHKASEFNLLTQIPFVRVSPQKLQTSIKALKIPDDISLLYFNNLIFPPIGQSFQIGPCLFYGNASHIGQATVLVYALSGSKYTSMNNTRQIIKE